MIFYTEAIGMRIYEDAGQADTHESLLREDAAYVWHPWAPNRISTSTVIAIAGQGSHITDAKGDRYLDAKASGMNATLGYANQKVVSAIMAQLEKLMTYDMVEGGNAPAIELARAIAQVTAPGLTRTFFCNSGSEGIETAIKVSRRYHKLLNDSQRSLIVSLKNCYHGTTLAASTCATSSASDEQGLLPAGFVSVPGPDWEAVRREGLAVSHSGIEALEVFFAEHGENISAFIVEPVQGIGGYIVPDNYLRAARALCTQYGAHLILDEVLTGFGRTGKMFAYEYAHITPDLLITSKGLTAGYMSLAAVTTHDKIFDVFEREKEMSGFSHGHTHSGHASACAAGLAVLDILQNDGVLGRVQQLSTVLREAVGACAETATVREIRCRGLLMAVEFDSVQRALSIKKHLQDNKILIRRSGRNIIFAPPLNIDLADIEYLATQFLDAVRVASAQ
ncbi:aspartate aminotransferase family protein [Pseudomonas syringae pv. actinidiae]|nr:aspartate aminotransferase family protein [Pseudomonas syringae pv. theae]NVL36985.1 aspartate aminotransferase family protein [Pseudomonas syringae pv. actinidiae]NVL50954.1 aspartate aminotransferase family protein [Pseudomonas syringae pv. actinidiae]NVL54319.1 aspartate aminotransferase family protein [Pseudomonas syringae pv. actinidiae]